MTAHLANSSSPLTSTPGYFALADDRDQPVGERIPGHVTMRLAGGQIVGGFTAVRPVTFPLPPGGLRRPWRQSRTELRRVPVLGRWVHVPRLRRRWVKPDLAGRVGFYSADDVLLWATEWRLMPSSGDTIGVSPVEIEAGDA